MLGKEGNKTKRFLVQDREQILLTAMRKLERHGIQTSSSFVKI